MSSIFNNQNIERMRVNGNEIALAKINGNVVFQKNKLLKTFFGDSKQDTTSGKNIFNVNDGSIYWDGCLISIKNNILKIKMESIGNGGITQQVITDYTDFNFDINENYYFSLTLKSGSYQKKSTTDTTYIRPYIKYEDGSTSYLSISLNENKFLSTKIKFTDNKKPIAYAFGVYSPNGTIANNSQVEYFVQIEKGSTATKYEPYTGGKPSPNPDYPQKISSINGASLKLIGKNLYNNEYTNNIVSNEGIITSNLNWNMSDYIEVEPNKSYTFSHNDENSTGQSLIIAEFDENKNFIKRNSQGNYNYETYEPYTIITNSNTKFIILNYNNTYNNSLFQLEKGSQVTTYEPYKVQTIPVNLQGNILAKVGDYADELQVYSNGDVKIVKKTGEILLNGTESKWSFVESGSIWPFRYVNEEIKFNNSNFTVFNYLCDYYIPKSATMYNNSIGQLGLTQSVCFRNDSIESLEEFKEWLSLHNTKVFFQLEEILEPKRIQNIKEELNQFGDYSNIEIETTYS